MGLAAAGTILASYGDLEVYFPVPEHRARWTGDANLIVTAVLGDDRSVESWAGFDLDGNVVPLSIKGPPKTPVLVIHSPEGFFPLRRFVDRMQCYEDCAGGGGGGGGGTPPPPPPGFFMVAWQIDDDYEGWTGGSPEFEMVAWHWTGQWGFTSNGGRIPIKADNFFTCTSGDYPSSDPRDWYYNTPPDHNTAAQYGLSGIQILSGDEVYTFPPRPGIPILMVTENDDTPCIEGGFPTAWDPYFPENNDEFVGAIQLNSLTTASDVQFYGDEEHEEIPLVHAIISFLRR